jgi:hypothetical protein
MVPGLSTLGRAQRIKGLLIDLVDVGSKKIRVNPCKEIMKNRLRTGLAMNRIFFAWPDVTGG